MLKTLKTVFTQRTHEGTTERLLQLSFSYLALYIITGYLVKLFTKSSVIGGYLMTDIQYTLFNTLGGMLICVVAVLAWGWYRFRSTDHVKALGLVMPRELLYIIPSGICTAIVIPTTTLMYTLPISVMVAMIIMRASIIVISRLIDAVQIRQGILKKTVYWQENVAVIFALLAVSIQLLNFKDAAELMAAGGGPAAVFHQLFVFKPGTFDFIGNAAAMTILFAYLTAYTIRIYIMNYYKNTRPKGAVYDTKGFFAVEQMSATAAILIGGTLFFLYASPDPVTGASSFAFQFQDAVRNPHHGWWLGLISGVPFGVSAFFSVFLFMFKGRTATFAGLVNRLTSLIAGTLATLLVYASLGGKAPAYADWAGLSLIFIAIYFMGKAEKRRACELQKDHEVDLEKGSEIVCQAPAAKD